VIDTLQIRNFKSIRKIDISLGRINVLIGENGAGKSNLLEAVALAGAAAAGKLDNEFLISRGIRVTDPKLMRSAFSTRTTTSPIQVIAKSERKESKVSFKIQNENTAYSSWFCDFDGSNSAIDFDDYIKGVNEYNKNHADDSNEIIEHAKIMLQGIMDAIKKGAFEEAQKSGRRKISIPVEAKIEKNGPVFKFISAELYKFAETSRILSKFIVYSPENSALRVFEREGQVQPLGVNGEGLLKLLQVIGESDKKSIINEIKENLRYLGWFKGFDLADESSEISGRLSITDRFISKQIKYFDQRSANEGFLFLLFYFCLFSSDLTPSFFAVDNVDASLNPKLCEFLIKSLFSLSVKHNKQSILTTHNPAVLDGLNLDDDDQRLFVVWRDEGGFTSVRRVTKNKKDNAELSIRMSEAFIRGSLGGLPRGFYLPRVAFVTGRFTGQGRI